MAHLLAAHQPIQHATQIDGSATTGTHTHTHLEISEVAAPHNSASAPGIPKDHGHTEMGRPSQGQAHVRAAGAS